MNRYFGQQTLQGEWHALLPRYILVSDRVAGKRILDIGCGTGIGSSMLREMGAIHVDAIDHRPAVLEIAQMRHDKDGLKFHVMFWEELAFEDDAFDLVLCLDPASPVTDPSLLLEIRRVLKPEGEYICAVERKNVKGFESLLPRYGYTESAENIVFHGACARVPQIGEVKRFFNLIHPIVQRPRLSYIFQSDQSPYLSVPPFIERSFCDPCEDTGGVEIWFCSDLPSAPLPEKVIDLPYLDIVNRLQEVTTQMQMQTVAYQDGSLSDDLFDQIIDEPTENRYITYPSEPSLPLTHPANSDLAQRYPVDPSAPSPLPYSRSLNLSSDPFSLDSESIEDIVMDDRSRFSIPLSRSSDFEERLHTNVRSHFDSSDPSTMNHSPQRSSSHPEIQHLKTMVDNLASVVEKQTQILSSLVQAQGHSFNNTPIEEE